MWLELWLDPQQTSGEAAPLAMVASVAASLAAQDPQLTPDGAALVALVVGNHRQALCWAALVTLVAPDTAPLAALGLQLTHCWAALMRLVAPVAAPLAALGLQQTPAVVWVIGQGVD